ncbi:MAG TPA: alpha/beta hydrolase-fold protein [Bacteroidales bacterium]|nr:alpha/beta hydrolase-fold protein [Bacteroidales bacterium]
MPTLIHIITIIVLTAATVQGCTKTSDTPDPDPDYIRFATVSALQQKLGSLAAITDSTIRQQRINTLWDSLKANAEIPFRRNDTVLFLFKSTGINSLQWVGDFNGWNANSSGWAGERLAGTHIWWLLKTFPPDARLDYKIVANGNWILDTDNPYVQYSGFGPNSELRMPQWVFPEETRLQNGTLRGTLSEAKLITSSAQNLGYQVRYRVYTPHNYANLTKLPVVYVTDGHEYADDRLGAMLIVLDNLIHQNKIRPVMAVFIDPRDPATGNNRRMNEYRANIRFANFVADELVPAIDQAYKTDTAANQRAILGTSLGGWNSAFFGMMRYDRFRLIGIHSPAFDNAIIQQLGNSPRLPLKIYMSTGTIFDTQVQARSMKAVLDEKGYPLRYTEVNQGHSWGNWRALIDEPLEYFFPAN